MPGRGTALGGTALARRQRRSPSRRPRLGLNRTRSARRWRLSAGGHEINFRWSSLSVRRAVNYGSSARQVRPHARSAGGDAGAPPALTGALHAVQPEAVAARQIWGTRHDHAVAAGALDLEPDG